MKREKITFVIVSAYCLAVAEACCWLGTGVVLESLRSYRIYAKIEIYPGISTCFLQIGWWFCALPVPWLIAAIWAITRKEFPREIPGYFGGTLAVTLILFVVIAVVSGLIPWLPMYCRCHFP